MSKRNKNMKIFNINSLLCALMCVSTAQSSTNVLCAQLATPTQHVIIKDLDGKIYECAQKYIHHFENLTLTNLKQKAVHIENLRVELLFYIKRSEKPSHYYSLQQALEKLDIHNQPMQAINDFKKILKLLPETTRQLINNTITDPLIKGFLVI